MNVQLRVTRVIRVVLKVWSRNWDGMSRIYKEHNAGARGIKMITSSRRAG